MAILIACIVFNDLTMLNNAGRVYNYLNRIKRDIRRELGEDWKKKLNDYYVILLNGELKGNLITIKNQIDLNF